VLFFLFTYTAFIYLPLQAQFWIGWGFLGLFLVFRKILSGRPDLQRIILILIGVFLTSRYWLFRTTDTLVYFGFFDFVGLMLLFLAESYAILTYFLGMFVNAFPLRREIQPVDLNDPELPTVDVFIPTYNEPISIVETTAAAAMRLDYPKEKLCVCILDDGGTLEKRLDPDPEKSRAAQERHESLKALAESLGVTYITRDRNLHAKAGNVNEALLRGCSEEMRAVATRSSCMLMGMDGTAGELILILDCDHVPTRDLLKNTVGHFLEDDRLFLVQTPHFFINPDPVEKNLATFLEKPSENEMFYGGVHLGLDFWNASFFCGSAAILRRRHLAEVGGLSGETITEDAETALTLHARGYNSVYIARPMVCGLSPETFADFIIQRSRWAQGMTQILMLKNPLLLKGLSIAQRICYFNTCIFWLFGFSRLIFFLAPLFYIYFGLNIYPATLSQVLAYAGPHIVVATMMTDYMFGDLRHPFFSELYEVVQSIFNVPTVIGTILRPRSPSFKVTPKVQSLKSDILSPLALPFYIMLIAAMIALPLAAYRWFYLPLERDAVYITLFWNCFNLFLVLLCLGAVWERRQLRRKHRIRTAEGIHVRPVGREETYSASIFDLSEDGVGFSMENDPLFRTGEQVYIHAEDSSGHEYTLLATLRRVADQTGGGLVCGAEFQSKDADSRGDIISYVYGDSQRWEDFWQRRRLHREKAWSGIVYLAFKGLTSSARNFSGLFRLIWIKLINNGERIWRIVKPDFSISEEP
jgi:cellulose synthase (UDP-forming)